MPPSLMESNLTPCCYCHHPPALRFFFFFLRFSTSVLRVPRGRWSKKVQFRPISPPKPRGFTKKKPQKVLCDFQVFPVSFFFFFLLRCPYVCYRCTRRFCSCAPFSMWSFLLRKKQKAISSRAHKSYCSTNCSPRPFSGNFIYSLFVLRLCYCSWAL